MKNYKKIIEELFQKYPSIVEPIEDILSIEHILPIPTENDWQYCSERVGTQFSEDFKSFIELTCSYNYSGTYGVVSYPSSNFIAYPYPIWKAYETDIKDDWWDENYIPFVAVGNGDEYCIRKTTEKKETCSVYYFDHEDNSYKFLAHSIEEWLMEDLEECFKYSQLL